MFRRGNKEIDYAEEATRAVASLSPDVIEKLPPQLRSRLLGSLPQFEGEIRGVIGLVKVLQADYKPYELPPHYYVAEWEGRSWRRLFRQSSPVSDLEFKPPMLPMEIMVKYCDAVGDGLFDRFLVASPEWWQNFDSDDTRMTRKVMLPVVLVGLIPKNAYDPVKFEYTEKQLIDPKGKKPVRQRPDAPGCLIKGGICFLIASVPAVNP